MQSHDDCRLNPNASAGTYLAGFPHTHMILNQQNSTHDMNKSLPAAPTGMYQQNTGAISGSAPQHHQQGMGGPSPTAAMMQGQQQMTHRHMANITANFQPRNNSPQMQNMSRPPMGNIVQHGNPQAPQSYQTIPNVLMSQHAHPQFQQMFTIPQHVLQYQQRTMQYPTAPIPQYSAMYSAPQFYNSPASTTPGAYFQMQQHLPNCPPAVNNMQTPNPPAQTKRIRKIMPIIHPETGKNVLEDYDNDSSRDSSRSGSVHASRESARTGGPDPDSVCSAFAAQVAAVATKTKVETQSPSEIKGVGDPESVVIVQPESLSILEHPNDSGNGEMPAPVICDQFIVNKEVVAEHEDSSVLFSKRDRLDLSSSISDSIQISSETKEDPEHIEPVENESYSIANCDIPSSIEKMPREYPVVISHDRLEEVTAVLPEILMAPETTVQDSEITNTTNIVEEEIVLNCAEETTFVVNEQSDEVKTSCPSSPTEAPTSNKVAECPTFAALKTEKLPEGKKNKGKKKKENINKKGDSKEGSEMDAFLVASEAEQLTESPSAPSLPDPVVPEDLHHISPQSPPPVHAVNDDILDSVTVANESIIEPVEVDTNDEVTKEEIPLPVEEPEDTVETPISDAGDEVTKAPMVLKYTYKEDQWSPLNPEGKKHYDRDFLIQMQAQPMSLKKPLNLPNLEVIKDKAQIYKVSDINRAPVPPMQTRTYGNDPFMPQYARGGGAPRPSPHGGINRRSQQGRDKPKKVISFSSSLNQTVKLHESTNAWKPQATTKPEPETAVEDLKNEEVYKRVRGILNKLTPQKFDTLVKQVQDLDINTEERLKGVIDLVFEKAIDEPNFSVPYAQMCKQLALLKVPFSDQEGFVNFRKLLLTKCQKEFEQDSSDELKRVEKQKLIDEAEDEKKKKQLVEESDEEERKNRRRQLGNIRFIGELFKLGMLTEIIMHECIKKLLAQGDEDSLECLCRLLTTIGKELETKKDKMSVDDFNAKKASMNKYMEEMATIINRRQTSSRVRFMLQDVIDLKKNSWKPRRNDDNPKTIDQIHKDAEREMHEQQIMLQNMPFSSSNKRPPDDRRKSTGRNPNYDQQDGWSIASSKTNKVNYSVDPQKLQLSKAAEMDNTIQLGPSTKTFFNWGRGSSGGNKQAPEPEKTGERFLGNRYSALADQMPPNAQSYEARRNSQRSAASSRESSRGRNNQLPPQSLRKTPSTSKERENVLETVSRLTRPAQQQEPKPVEPKVPPVSSVNGKDTITTTLKGPELSEEDIERKTRALMDEFLHNADFKEAQRCMTELASPSTIHMVISSAINHVLERSSQSRYSLGQLLHNLVQSKHITLEQYNKGVKSILELVDDYALDIPLIWDYLAEIIEPMMEGADTPLSFLAETLQPCVPSLTAGKLVAAILLCASKKRGTIKVGEIWRESGLKWSTFLPAAEKLPEFIKLHNVEFTVSQTIPQPATIEMPSVAEMKKKFDFYLQNDAQNNEPIFDWIESHIGGKTTEHTFLRALVTAVFENAISGTVEKCELNVERLKSRLSIIQHYINHKEELELQALYALQALILRLNQPKGILNQLFDILYDDEVIGEETFDRWETSQDPAEQEGKGVAVNSVSSFFTWLREADNESSVEDG